MKALKALAAVILALACGEPRGDAALLGQVVADPARPAWLLHHRGCPLFICGPGDPEDFLYRGTLNPDGTRSGDQQELIDRLAATGANAVYVQIVRSHGGDGDSTHNPFIAHDPLLGLNSAVLDQWDEWFEAMDHAGIVIFLFFYDDEVCIWNCGSPQIVWQEWQFVQGIVNRFEHRPNLVWVLAEEYQEMFSAERMRNMARLVRTADDHDHVIAVHQMPGLNFDFANDVEIDQFAIQYGNAQSTPDQLHAAVVTAWHAAAGRYNLVMSEIPDGGLGTGSAARRKLWAMAMGGASVLAQGWDIASTPTARLEECGWMASFMDAMPLRFLAPHDELAHSGTDYVLADSMGHYIAYARSADGGVVGLHDLPSGSYNLRWLDVVDGTLVEELGESHEGGDATFSIPSGIGDELAVYVRLEALDTASNLTYESDKETMIWCHQELLGSCTVNATYDTLRSSSPWDFMNAVCIEAGGHHPSTTDTELPPPGSVFHYHVRQLTSCPGGESSLGVDSDGNPRTGLDCH